MVETILGSLVGGVFRLVPEVLRWFDRKDERKHELKMQDKQLEFQKLMGTQKIEEAQVQYDTAGIETLKEAIKGQETPSGVRWVDGFSKLMRPLITFQWVILLYPVVILAGFFLSIQQGVSALEALKNVFGEPEKALVGAICNFWFLDRILKRDRK